MEQTKIQFSQQQLQLAGDAKWILTKNAIMQKIKRLMETLYTCQQKIVHNTVLPPTMLPITSGKISKGENYEGLPYLVLDYPRVFVKGNVFAIRSFFWWGQFFSTTLHLSGEWQRQYAGRLARGYPLFTAHNFFVNNSHEEWVHDVSSPHYQQLKNISQEKWGQQLLYSPFIKVAAYTPVSQLNEAAAIWMQQFEVLVNAISCPGDGRVLSPDSPKAGFGL